MDSGINAGTQCSTCIRGKGNPFLIKKQIKKGNIYKTFSALLVFRINILDIPDSEKHILHTLRREKLRPDTHMFVVPISHLTVLRCFCSHPRPEYRAIQPHWLY